MEQDAFWDGTISKLRISSQVYPELFENLKKIPQRERGERLRLLAYIGLQLASDGIRSMDKSISIEEKERFNREIEAEKKPSINEGTENRKNKFLEGI